MIDSSTKAPLEVDDGGIAGPYLWVPLSQLEEVQRLLDTNGVKYGVDEVAISLDDEPEQVVVNFGRNGDREAIQRMLDAAP
jgi:hypothetical protein